MTKKSTISKAADAVATQVVVESVEDAVNKGGAKLDAAGPELQKSAAAAKRSPVTWCAPCITPQMAGRAGGCCRPT
jgi:hypothetical protein